MALPPHGSGASVSIDTANALLESGDYPEAMQECAKLLLDNPNDPPAVFLLAMVFTRVERWGFAYNLYKRFIEIKPDIPEGWNNLGHVCQQMGRFEEAEGYLMKALEISPNTFPPLNNLCLHEASQCRPWKALYWGKKALPYAKSEQQKRELQTSLSLPNLMLKRWGEGWDCFEGNLGDKPRLEKKYGGLSRWDGTPGQAVVIYGEQGIGDELMFASMVPDALKDCRAIIDCDHRLQGLFRRSFPVPVYGTRRSEEYWLPHHQLDAQCAVGSLGKLYRRNGEFPRTPYLIADPERRVQWRALLDTFPGKKIGLAWTGGSVHTRAVDRSVTLEQLKPLLDTGNTFVSLQYKGAPEAAAHGVHHWTRAVQTDDYDDTAALVAELDCVVSVTTAVALLAGAIGTKCHVLVPDYPTWHWGIDGEMPWYPLELYRKKGREWGAVINEVAKAL
jgi:tetratricopeptide (TPR) repeat protein